MGRSPPPAAQSGSTPQHQLPVPESPHDLWSVVCADLEGAIGPIRRDAIRFHLPPVEVDDAVQDALCQAWAKRESHDPSRPLIPWLRGYGCRAIRSRLMAMRMSDEYLDPVRVRLVDQRELLPDECSEIQEIRHRIARLVDLAPLGYRDLLRARYWEGLPISELAARLGLSNRAVEGRLRRGLVWLETALVDQEVRSRRAGQRSIAR